MKNITSQSGLTLIEVLIATLVLAVALGAIFVSLGNNTRALTYIENKTFAAILAQNQAVACTLNSPAPANSGGESMLNRSFLWTINGDAITVSGGGASVDAFCSRLYTH